MKRQLAKIQINIFVIVISSTMRTVTNNLIIKKHKKNYNAFRFSRPKQEIFGIAQV